MKSEWLVPGGDANNDWAFGLMIYDGGFFIAVGIGVWHVTWKP